MVRPWRHAYFWKPENDNQHAAHFAERLAVWKDAAANRTVKSIKQEKGEHATIVKIDLSLPVGADMTLTYSIDKDGSIFVDADYRPTATAIPLIPKFGMRMRLPAAYNQVRYYGRGPWENYPDRQSSALLGRYSQQVSEQYHYGYVRTQESGNHGGLRWLRLLDEGGNGLEMTAAEPFAASALPLSLRDLDVAYLDGGAASRNHSGQFGAAQHSLELKAKAFENRRSLGTTYVHVDQAQMGVGGINSWGEWPLKEYRIPAAPRCFRFHLRPVKN